jgi:7-cyano-7-deazaguanine synthase in queuosine biosynthesis
VTTLAMFSGGLDSTAMLVKLLAQSADELRVHHIHLVNREGRDRAESRAVKSIVAYLRQRYRPFRYSESALDFSSLEAIPIDYLSIAFVACQVAIDTPGCTRIAVGSLASDTDIANRRARQTRVFEVMHECYRARKLGEPQVEWVFPVFETPKAELAAALPQELLDLTWSCRRPVEGIRPCLVCKACRAREQSLRTYAAAAENRALQRGGAP